MAISKKTVLYSLGLFALCFVGIPFRIDKPSTINDLVLDAETQFNLYMRQFNRTYLKGTSEYSLRLSNFQKTLERIENRTRAHRDDTQHHHHRAKFGLTKFSDMSPDEFHETLLKHRHSSSSCLDSLPFHLLPTKTRRKRAAVSSFIPPKKDWRDHGVITPVKNQRNCGACWAFSTVETVETMHALATGRLTELSVQQMIDCAQSGNMGCLGGDTCTALRWLAISNTSLVTDYEYPLKFRKDFCSSMLDKDGVRITANYTCYNLVTNEEVIENLLANHGPLTVAVDAAMWQDYLGGIIRYHCETTVNHAVQIVGYDKTGPVPYYIVRNSWGTDFGIDGYVHIEMGKNLCGIAREVSAVDVQS